METDDRRRHFIRREGVKHRALLLLLVLAIVSLVSYCLLLPELEKLVSQKSPLSTGTISPEAGPVVPTFDSIPVRQRVVFMKDLPVSITLSTKASWGSPLRELLQTVSRIFKTAVRLFCGMPEEHRNVLGL